MDFETYDLIPQRVLIYFTYSNSLDYLEKAYLYSNVLRNKEKYEEVYGAYYSKMLPFIEEQLLKEELMNTWLTYIPVSKRKYWRNQITGKLSVIFYSTIN